MIVKQDETALPYCAMLSEDEGLRDLFLRACMGCDSAPVISGETTALSASLDSIIPQQFILDMNLPAETVRSFLAMRARHSHWNCIPVTAVISRLHHSISARYMFSNGITTAVERTLTAESLAAVISSQLKVSRRWSRFSDEVVLDRKIQICLNSMNPAHREETSQKHSLQALAEKISPVAFTKFIERMCAEFSLGGRERSKLNECMPEFVYQQAQSVGIPRSYVLRFISDYLMIPHISAIDVEKLQHGIFPPEFCRTNNVLPLRLFSNSPSLALGNPFDWELFDFMATSGEIDLNTKLYIIDPDLLEHVFNENHPEVIERHPSANQFSNISLDSKSTEELEKYIFEAAVKERATDIHIEPKADSVMVRFRVDGDLHDFACLKEIAIKLICRLKGKSEMDISESRRPQDGCFHATICDRRFRVRVASALTQYGESLSLRFLETDAGLKSLMELGMHDSQEQLMLSLSALHSGMLLFVGPTGSGKTTTIYSTLNHVDCMSRSLMSVEDPIEYSIPHANQQQVNVKSGNSYEVLLKSSVRQDPDILFVGEIRDTNSAKIAMDFTSTGRLTLTSMHTTNATTALFRLERLGIPRAAISECVLAVIAQRLVKKLCNDCKKVLPISGEDYGMLSAYFGNDVPAHVAYPSGCPRCNYTGYFGRTGIYEIVHFTPEITDMVTQNRSIAEIRHMLVSRGDFMMPFHALEKIKDLECSPVDIQSTVLLEESSLPLTSCPAAAQDPQDNRRVAQSPAPDTVRLLLVEDDAEAAALFERYLTVQGYEVDIAVDGIDALVKLGSSTYGLILSDVMMPDLDGFKLLEIMKQKSIETPVILMTALSDETSELHGFELGAVDYIHKPVKLDILKMRIDRFMHRPASPTAHNLPIVNAPC